jgi:hypothetical protein
MPISNPEAYCVEPVGSLVQGRLRDQPKALAEALTCASFLGRTSVAESLLKQGGDPSGSP